MFLKKCLPFLLIGVVLAGSLAISGCTKEEKTVAGVVGGGALGAGVGAAAGGTEGAVAGGLIGGVLGGVVGHSMGDDESEKTKGREK